MMNRTIWIYWENLEKRKPEPAYITLSRWTMLQNLNDCSLVIVTPENLEKYLPGINSLLDGIQVDLQGRADRLKRKLKNTRKNIAVKCDVIRAFLLYRYGGIYIDADAIVLDTLEPYFQILEDKDFFIARRCSHGKNHVSVGFYGSVPRSNIISKYVERIKTKLDAGKEIAYNDLGAGLLTPIVDEYIESVEILPEREIQPITFEEAREAFVSKSLRCEDILSENQRVFMLFSGPFSNELKRIDIQTLYSSDYFVSRVFRKALRKDSFESFFR